MQNNRAPAAPIGKVRKTVTVGKRRRSAGKKKAARRGGGRKMSAKQAKFFGKRKKR